MGSRMAVVGWALSLSSPPVMELGTMITVILTDTPIAYIALLLEP